MFREIIKEKKNILKAIVTTVECMGIGVQIATKERKIMKRKMKKQRRLQRTIIWYYVCLHWRIKKEIKEMKFCFVENVKLPKKKGKMCMIDGEMLHIFT